MSDIKLEKSRQPKIFLATPCYGGMVCQEYMQSVLCTLHSCMMHSVPLQVFMIGNESLIPRGRNQLVSEFMTSDSTHLLFVDSDIEFHPDDVLKLIQHDKDVVVGAYPLKMEPINYVVDCVSQKPSSSSVLREVKDAGTGFMMISRGAIEKMQLSHPELQYNGDLDNDTYRKDLRLDPEKREKLKQNLFSLFDTSHDVENNNNYLSEDYTFCRRWQKIGGKIWLDPTIKLNHIGRKVFRGDISRILQ